MILSLKVSGKHSKVNHYRITNPKNFTKIKKKYKPLLSFLAPDIDVKREITKGPFQINENEYHPARN